MKNFILILCLLLSAKHAAMAQAGSLDLSFDSDGMVFFAQGTNDELGGEVVLQSDGKIVVAGITASGSNQDILVLRYLANGTPDSSFSGDGMVVTDLGGSGDWVNCIAIQPDGKILVAGCYGNGVFTNLHCFIARYKPDGSLDTTFDHDGIVKTNVMPDADQIMSLAIQADGKIVAVGGAYDGTSYNSLIMRYHTNGSLDNSFDGDGKRIIVISALTRDQLRDVAIQADGKIVVTGPWDRGSSDYDIFLMRYNQDGSPDSTFDDDGFADLNIPQKALLANALVIQADGKIVVAGECSDYGWTFGDFLCVRYSSSGKLDSTFSGDGIEIINVDVWHDIAHDVILQADGKILLAGQSSVTGSTYYFAMIRLHPGGGLDLGFSSTGIVRTDTGSFARVSSMALQADGKIVLVGNTSLSGNDEDILITRYLSGLNVGIRNVFAGEDFVLYPNPVHGDELSLKLPEAMIHEGNMEIIITDVIGKQSHYKYPAAETIRIPLAGLSKGIYFLTVSSENISLTRKFSRL